MPDMFLANVWHMLGICRAYAGHMPGICQAYAWHWDMPSNMPGIMPSICKAFCKHSPDGFNGIRMMDMATAVPRAIILTRQDDLPQMPCHHPDLIGKSGKCESVLCGCANV